MGATPTLFHGRNLKACGRVPEQSGRSSNTLSNHGDVLATFRLLFSCREFFFDADERRLINGSRNFGHSL